MTTIAFKNAAPLFPVKDVERSLTWYQDVLGFKARHINRDPSGEDPTNYAVLQRDEAWLHLVLWEFNHEVAPDFSDRVRAAAAQIHTSGVKELYELLKETAASSVLQHLESKPWGAQDFTIQDPDGNRIVVSGNA